MNNCKVFPVMGELCCQLVAEIRPTEHDAAVEQSFNEQTHLKLVDVLGAKRCGKGNFTVQKWES